jgi:hypothetical protein
MTVIIEYTVLLIITSISSYFATKYCINTDTEKKKKDLEQTISFYDKTIHDDSFYDSTDHFDIGYHLSGSGSGK